MAEMTSREHPDTLPTADREQPTNTGSSQGMRVLSYLLAGPLAYGGIGWVIDHFWLHTNFLLPTGIVLGLALSIYVIIKRYGGDVTGLDGKGDKR